MTFSTIDWNLDIARERQRKRTIQKLQGIHGVWIQLTDSLLDTLLIFVLGMVVLTRYYGIDDRYSVLTRYGSID
jgi:hypothetical protein